MLRNIVIGIILISVAVRTTNATCSALSIGNGDVICTAENRHQSLCHFTCDEDFELSRSAPKSVYCSDGTWLVGFTRVVFDFATDVSCRNISGLGRSFARNLACASQSCSSRSAYSGIAEEQCRILGCCWDSDDHSCKEEEKVPCPNIYSGAPASLCINAGCIYNEKDRLCHVARSLDILNSISVMISPPTQQTNISARVLEVTQCLPNLTQTNSYVECGSLIDNEYSICEVSCNPGYYMVGNSSFVCRVNEDETWNASFDWECRGIKCPAIEEANATVACTNHWRVNSICEVQCSSNHESVGASSLRCGSDGKWRSGRFSCQEKPRCRSIRMQWPSASWDIMTYTCTNQLYVDSTCTFSCPDDHQLHGRQTTTCSDGEMNWSSRPPTCRSIRRSHECDMMVDLRNEQNNQQLQNNHIKIKSSIARLLRENRRRCNKRGVIEIDYTALQTFSFKLSYDSPVIWDHVEIGHQTSQSLFLGRFGFLYYLGYPRFNFLSIFQPGNTVTFLFNKVQSIVTITVAQRGRTRNLVEVIHMPTLNANTKMFIAVNRRMHQSSSIFLGSGICSLCISYTEAGH